MRFERLDGLQDTAPDTAKAALRDAAVQLEDRGLGVAARWALELACCVRDARRPATSTPSVKAAAAFPTHSTPALGAHSPSWDAAPVLTPGTHLMSPSRSHRDESDSFYLARACFSQGEYERCAWLLERHEPLGPKERFLALYARFLIFERQLGDDDALPPLEYTVGGSAGAGGGSSLVPLLAHLVEPEDAFLLFLKGVILQRLHKRVEAMDCLIRSVQRFPYNWSAWLELSRTLSPDGSEREQILDLLPQSFMSVFFMEHSVRQSAQGDAAGLNRIDALLEVFPNSAYLVTCRAQCLYLGQELEEAADTFEQALRLDPFRLDGLSEYSNTLYVLDNAEALSQLVQQFAHVGRDRPEVCCLVGNYYNQRGDHFRAVEAFRRALRLDRGCVAAWILLGHEYLELKNSHAAAEMYRRALEINPQDYRPWHGLGQVYELNEAWSFAIHYYQKCAAIRPYDARMWASLGVCYERLGRTADAVACFKRHLTCPLSHLESVDALARIIDLYERDGDTQSSTQYHRLLVQVVEQHMSRDASLVARFAFSYIIAARWEMGELHGKLHGPRPDPAPRQGDLALAGEYLQKVVLAGTDMSFLAEELLKKLARHPD
ncbi:Anaphase-promoting complex subunit 8 [Malassezia cuniculi]|uniref:Anaphase-promoting complex subunit 8 n=1 Tax=Malassezia cuniculi TaxID=948313 RepID=A0AAF0EUS6_9BASI|nr:Anaphase-promoting complex subunit 8 [Malassezia cuniculi]